METRASFTWDVKHRMAMLLFDESLSDVTFLVDDPPSRYSCHKLILGTGSKVFEAMLYGKMAEKPEISVPDVTSNGFNIMLRYLYTDVVKIDSESDAFETAYASKKYLIKTLFKACEDYLLSHAAINLQTVVPLYEEATFLEMKRLKNRCSRYMSRNASRIFRSNCFVNVTEATFQDVLNMDLMHVNSEKEIIEVLWKWGCERCKENGLKCTDENVRNCTKDLVKYVRFLTLGAKELEYVFENFKIVDESEQLAILWNISMPRTGANVKMPLNLCGESRRRSISNSSRLELPTEYRYSGDLTNFSVQKHEQRVGISTTGRGVTIVGVVVAFKPVLCYSSLHRQLNIEVQASNETTNFQTSVKSLQKSSDQTGDEQLENELLLDDYIAFSDGEIGNLTVLIDGEGVRIMECMKQEFSREVMDSVIKFTFKADNSNSFLFPIKEIMCIPA